MTLSGLTSERAVISVPDVEVLYRVPMGLHAQGLDDIVVNQLKLGDKAGPADLSEWESVLDAALHPLDEVTIAVVGKYVDHQDAYKSVGEALKHGGLRQRTKVNLKWLEAQELAESTHEILLIEQDPARVAEIQEELGDIVMEGDGCEATVLEDAGAERANMLLAVTGDDEDNLVSCQVAKERFNVERTIARINNPKNESIFQKLNVDITVSATTAILAHIEPDQASVVMAGGSESLSHVPIMYSDRLSKSLVSAAKGKTVGKKISSFKMIRPKDLLPVQPAIAERGQPHGTGLGTFRWVVERTISWLHGFRRLRIRWERRDDIHEAFLGLAVCLITHRHVQRLC